MSIKMTLVAAATAVQTSFLVGQMEVVDSAIETAGSAARLGLQGFTILCLIALGTYMWRKDKRQDEERKERDGERKEQFNAILDHHEKFASAAKLDRDLHNKQLLEIAKESAVAMAAMAAATNGVKEWLKEHSWKPGRIREET